MTHTDTLIYQKHFDSKRDEIELWFVKARMKGLDYLAADAFSEIRAIIFDETDVPYTRQKTAECFYCSDDLGGGPGGWFSITTTRERCTSNSPTGFHEPEQWTVAPAKDVAQLDVENATPLCPEVEK